MISIVTSPVYASSEKTPQYQTPSNRCNQIELVFIIDQSGSMPGGASHPEPNDPDDLRFYAPLHVIGAMGLDSVISRAKNSPLIPIDYHVALIDFGSISRIGMDWENIAPYDTDNWDTLRDRLEEDVSATSRGLYNENSQSYSNLGNTNFVSALKTAKELFEQGDPQVDDCPRRAIFLLTDGMPFLDVEQDDFTIDSHMEEVKEIVTQDLYNLGVNVWVTAVNDSDDNYWQGMEPYWLDILPEPGIRENGELEQPKAALAQTQDEIGDRFTKLFREITERDSKPPPIGPVEIGPFLQEVLITFFKIDPLEEHLDIKDADGKALTPARTDVEVELFGEDQPIETLRVKNPIPGTWVIDITVDRSDILLDLIPIPAFGQIIEPIDDLIQYIKGEVAFQIVDIEDNPLPDYSDTKYKLDVDADLQFGDQRIKLVFTSDPDQVYRASVIPISLEKHELSVRATSKRPIDYSTQNFEDFIVIESVIGKFNVRQVEVERLDNPLVESDSAGGCEIQRRDQITIYFQTQTADEKTPVILDLPVTWEAQLQGPNTASQVVIDGPDENGKYKAVMTVPESGVHQLSVSAVVTDLQGNTNNLYQDTSAFTFDAAPVDQIELIVTAPDVADQSWWQRLLSAFGLADDDPWHQTARTPLRKWNTTSLDISLINPITGMEVDPEKVLVSQSDIPIQVIITDKENNPVGEVIVEETAVAGRYQAKISGLEIDDYGVYIGLAPDVQAFCGYSLPGHIDETLKRTENPIIYAEYIILILLLILGLLILLRFLCRRRNAADGYLTILDSDGRPAGGWYRSLHGRNRWRLKNVPAITGISEIQVSSTESSCGRNPYPKGAINVTLVQMDLFGEDEGLIERIWGWLKKLFGQSGGPRKLLGESHKLSLNETRGLRSFPGFHIKFVKQENQIFN